MNIARSSETKREPEDSRARFRLGRWLAAQRVDLLLVLLALLAVGPFVQRYTAQPASRYALTAAIWDNHTVDLDEYRHAVWVDSVEFEGELRSDKPPMQPLLAVPAYASYRAVGGEPAVDVRVNRNLGLWWVTLWSSVVPFAALLVMMRRQAARFVSQRVALVTALSIGFGTLLFPFASQLYGHLLEASLAFGSWVVLKSCRPTRLNTAIAGALAGAAVATGYSVGVVAVVLSAYVIVRRQHVLWWFAGAVPFVLIVVGYNALAFDSPLRVSYGVKHDGAFGVGNEGVNPENPLKALFSPRGYLGTTPIVLLAILGALRAVVRRTVAATEALIALAILAGFLLLLAFWSNPWGGEMPGPRYTIPLMPFLVLPLATIWDRLRVMAAGLTFVSVIMMTLPTITRHLVNVTNTAASTVYLRRLFDEPLVPTLWSIGIGNAGWLLHVATVGAVLGALFATVRTRADESGPHRANDPTYGATGSTR